MESKIHDRSQDKADSSIPVSLASTPGRVASKSPANRGSSRATSQSPDTAANGKNESKRELAFLEPGFGRVLFCQPAGLRTTADGALGVRVGSSKRRRNYQAPWYFLILLEPILRL
ncbi:MAG TPA: hypothetical protein VKR55_06015 [Bradyrhizobium sp.]|uniref:hypothetical protein n=1 Tax=Bradyrhizobium sp. TaxID=376 RepID=UPI002C74D5BB|nr:hypothetical protein [Bradyrhizobium sp.]HLZ01695.1 hypothetical protein [Bradyrhizobium sp.]